MRHPSSARRLSFLLMGGIAVSCICGGEAALIDRLPFPHAFGDQTVDVMAEAGSTVEPTPFQATGEPYRVAAFSSGAAIFLIFPPEDAVVTTPWVDVAGKAPAETVITLDDEIAVAGPDGMFSARVPLDEGLNEIQCVASDWEGHEAAFSIFIEYVPEG